MSTSRETPCICKTVTLEQVLAFFIQGSYNKTNTQRFYTKFSARRSKLTDFRLILFIKI